MEAWLHGSFSEQQLLLHAAATLLLLVLLVLLLDAACGAPHATRSSSF